MCTVYAQIYCKFISSFPGTRYKNITHYINHITSSDTIKHAILPPSLLLLGTNKRLMVRCCLSGLQSLFTLWILFFVSCNCFDIVVVWQSGCQRADKLKFMGIHCAVERWNALHASVVIERRTYGRKSELSKLSPQWLSWAFDWGRTWLSLPLHPCAPFCLLCFFLVTKNFL